MRALLLALLAVANVAAAEATCVGCHAGAAARSYALSKHGVIARIEAARPRVRAPGCADCHTAEARTSVPPHYASAAQRSQARAEAAAGCGRCHSPRYVAAHVDAGERGRAIGEMKLREAQALVEASRTALPRELVVDIEARVAAMRDEHMRDLRLGFAHQSPDYQWWHGQAALDGGLLRIKGAIGEGRRRLPTTGRSGGSR